MYLFDFYEEKMLTRDFDLNSVPQATDSLKDIFKQTMLDQEIIFRKQVCELHRLYHVQKTLMKDHTPLELETVNSWKANAQSFSRETGLPTNSIPMLDSRVSSSPELLEGWQGNSYKIHPRPFDLELLPDQYTSLVDNNLPHKVKVGDHLKESIDLNSLPGGDLSDPLDLSLSPTLGVAKGKKEDKESRYDKKTNACSRIFIDLEESTEMTTSVDEKHSSFDAAEIMYSGGKNDSRVTINSDPISSECMKKDLSHEIVMTGSIVGNSKWQQQTYSVQGLKHNENMPHENLWTGKEQFTSCGVGFDLNVQLDDSSCHSDDAILVHPLTNSNNEDWRTKDQVRSSANGGTKECETSLISPAFESRPQMNMSEESGGHGGNKQNGRDELMLKLQNGHAPGLDPACIVAIQSGCEKTGEADNVLCSDKIGITVEDEHPNGSSPSGKSSCISGDDSGPVRTTESGTRPCNSNLADSGQFSGSNGRSKVAETLSGEQDQRSSGSNEIKNECCDNREESVEVDDLIQIAAESLMLLSSKNSACYQETSNKTASNELENENKEQPQRSYDSFELMNLELPEMSAADYCVSSKPFEVSEELTKDSGIKLRRGRRLKDFQKDILPGMASLSRQEIREDMNILKGVLRSREYKKMRAKMVQTDGESWCKPVRSRRSRRNSVGRKTFR
ncbi:hypothetical protein GQ457_11G022750 [Hibiscus cannabinus]